MEMTTEEAIRTHAIATYPREACGLVIVAGGREHYVPCRNVAPPSKRAEHFVLAPEDFADAEDAGVVVALVHSHPDVPAQPSQADRVCCEASGLVWHIVRVDGPQGAASTAELVTLSPSGYRAPLIGREFFHGVLDCYALVKDWFLEERGIELMEFPRRDNWWADGSGEDLYLKQFRSAGFVPIDRSGIRVGDCFIMQHHAEVANHAGVYIGDGLFLHHLYGRLSTRDVYDGYWQEITRMVVRYVGT